MKLCTTCGKNPRVEATDARKRYCRECWSARANTWNKKNRQQYRSNQLKRKFGIDIAEYERLLAAQDGVCAICKELCPSGRALAVDHDHKTGKVRGLLCGSCNRGIGLLKESPLVLHSAANYLNAHSSRQ